MYDDDEVVKAVTAYMDKMDEQCDAEQGYLFIRLGEMEDDNEVRGFLYENPFDLHRVRRIAFEIGIMEEEN